MNKNISLLAMLLLLFNCSTKSVTEKYDAFVQRIESKQVTSDSSLVNEDPSKLSKEFQSYMGDISANDLDLILDHELNGLRKEQGDSIAATGAAIPSDTTRPLAKRCASSDNAGPQVSKSFRKERLYFVDIVPRRYHVRLAIHVIDHPTKGEIVSDDEIRNQIAILNAAFEPANIVFEFSSLDRHSNVHWYTAAPGSKDDSVVYYFEQMTSTLALDPKSHINLFVNGLEFCGFGNFPWNPNYQKPTDCIIISDLSFPNKLFNNVPMEGKTVIHEMGHYFGLFHTFHSDQKDSNGEDLGCGDNSYDGCDRTKCNGVKCQRGDLLVDTPAQKICHFDGCGSCEYGKGCDPCQNPKPCDTCPALEGPDPVTNFMGYNPDLCMNHFTRGQYQRINLYFLDKRRGTIQRREDLF